MKKNKKGNFGYIKRQRIIEILKTAFMLALSIGLYNLGLYSAGSKNNLLTYVAILGCLPMAKFAVNAVVFCKAKGCSKAVYDEINSLNLKPMFYDLYFTGEKVNFQASVADYKKKNLILLSEDTNISTSDGEEHLRNLLKNCGYENITIKIFTDKNKFMERLKELNEMEETDKDLSFLFDNLLSISI